MEVTTGIVPVSATTPKYIKEEGTRLLTGSTLVFGSAGFSAMSSRLDSNPGRDKKIDRKILIFCILKIK
jgi:hypothetical protein